MNIEIRFLHILVLSLFLTGFSPCLHADVPAESLGLKTVVIDPGHGGKDPGALGKTSRTSEKHVVLSVAKLLGSKIKAAYPDVKVVYTRSSDVFVELNERARIAKRSKADLFISIHCNSNNSPKPYGASAHILGPKSKNRKNQKDYFAVSMDVARRENSVILLEDNYETTYQGFDPDSPESVISHNLMWNANYENSLMFAAEVDGVFCKPPFRPSDYTGIHQDTFLLLWATNMPAALLEIGFISNPSDYKVLSSASGQEQIAQSLFNAFAAYKKKYDMTLDIDTRPEVQTESVQTLSSDMSETFYGVQVMTLSRELSSDDPSFKGYEATAVKSGNVYKYIIGRSVTGEEAEKVFKEVSPKFPGAFLVKVTGETAERL